MESSDPTELAGLAEASTEMVEAWSLAEDLPDVEPRISARTLTVCGVAASLAAVVGAGWLVVNRAHAPEANIVKVVERTTISVAPPSTITPRPVAQPTVTAAPKQVAPPPKRDPDTQLLSEMSSNGWHIERPENIITYAHWYCDGLAKGTSPASLQARILLNASGEMNQAAAQEFGARVQRIYGCG